MIRPTSVTFKFARSNYRYKVTGAGRGSRDIMNFIDVSEERAFLRANRSRDIGRKYSASARWFIAGYRRATTGLFIADAPLGTAWLA